MQKKLAEISKTIGGKLTGDGGHLILGVAPIDQAEAHEITFAVGPRYIRDLKKSKAGAVILAPDVKPPAGMNAITVDNPSLAFTRVVEMFKPSETAPSSGIHP
ncbi:MAG: UDP-3-O-(3-hydroxymyristoyl)glucosamine N-acyltransferase, partial [Thermoplasmata archaeon]|nr:UDP-3-O-(3-hydroxymyristoyl)glucosamine N-acyltransferase [Thermoplasmata archaeon]